MISERLVEQTRRAEDRYKRDYTRREERKHHVAQLLRKKKNVDWSLIDESHRINARAQMLGITMADFERGKATELRMPERILAEDDLIPAEFLHVGARVSSCVGRIHIRDRHRRRAGFGTGFMISPRLMMTNNHVLESAAHGTNSTIEFDFVEGLLDSVQTSRFFSLDPETFFLTSPGLDYTIVAVGTDYDESEAQRRGWLSLIEESGKILVGERLKNVALRAGFLTESDNAIRATDTGTVSFASEESFAAADDEERVTAGVGLNWQNFKLDVAVSLGDGRDEFLVSFIYRGK